MNVRGFLVICVLNVCGALLLQAGPVDQSSNIPTEIDGVPIPPLRPMSADEAHQLLRYVRELRTNQELPSKAVAWAAVNRDCTWRTLLEYWAIATSPRELSAGDRPPVLTMEHLTPEKLQALEAAPTRDVAVIQTAAELDAHLTWLYPNGSEVPFKYDISWSDHYSVVINVEGTIKVVDLSIGDTPVDIQEWFRSFVPARHKYCWHMNESEAFNLWTYWLMATIGNSLRPDLLTDENRACGYSIVPLHLAKAVYAHVGQSAFTMDAGDVFLSVYQDNLPGEPLPEWDTLPYFHIRYNAMTREEVCAANHYVYCPESSTAPGPDPCSSNPCKNDGLCRPLYNRFLCSCTSDYVGPLCTLPNPCSSNPCPEGELCNGFIDANDHPTFECVSATAGVLSKSLADAKSVPVLRASLMIPVVMVAALAVVAAAVAVFCCVRRKRQQQAVQAPAQASVEFLKLVDVVHDNSSR